MSTTGSFKSLDSSSDIFEQVIRLDAAEFPRPWKKEDWFDLNWDHHQLFGQVNGSALSAFALFGHLKGDDTSHLLKICLPTSLRGSGLSSLFWKSCESELKSQGIKSVYLEVEGYNLRAQGFYQKLGFKLLRKIPAYYSDGADALTMQLTL